MAMGGKLGISIVILFVICNCGYVYSSADIMTDIAKGFAKALDECKKELNLEESIIAELYYFWKEDYDKVTRNVGCAILCMSKRLELVTGDSKMHHANAEEFAKKHGADQQMAKKLVEIIHGCEKTNDGIEDECVRVLEISKCFRTDIDKLSWTPNMQEILGEIMSDG